MEIKIGYYENYRINCGLIIPIEKFLEYVKFGKQKALIEAIREESNLELKRQLKLQLNCITTSAIFDGRKKIENLKKHTGLIQLDIDSCERPYSLKSKLESDPYTLSTFISSNGTSVKAVFKIMPDVSEHSSIFEALEDYFKERYNAKLDNKCKNINKLMFSSYDPDLYYNPNSKIFKQAIMRKLEETYPAKLRAAG